MAHLHAHGVVHSRLCPAAVALLPDDGLSPCVFGFGFAGARPGWEEAPRPGGHPPAASMAGDVLALADMVRDILFGGDGEAPHDGAPVDDLVSLALLAATSSDPSCRPSAETIRDVLSHALVGADGGCSALV